MKFPWTKTLEDKALEESLLLDRDILNRELQLIDDQFRIQAQRAKKDYILNWLQRETPRSLNTQNIENGLLRDKPKSTTATGGS